MRHELCDMKHHYKHTTSSTVHIYNVMQRPSSCIPSCYQRPGCLRFFYLFWSSAIFSVLVFCPRLYTNQPRAVFYYTWRLPCSSIWLPICYCTMLTGCMYLASAMYLAASMLLCYANRAVEANKDKCRKGCVPEQRTQLRFRENHFAACSFCVWLVVLGRSFYV